MATTKNSAVSSAPPSKLNDPEWRKTYVMENYRKSGKDFIKLDGLLDLAHEDGLCRIETEILQFPEATPDGTVTCKATVETRRGTFSGMGDANPKNGVAGAHRRHAESRAIARALRWATNCGMVSLEEMDEKTLAQDDEPSRSHSAPAGAPSGADYRATELEIVRENVERVFDEQDRVQLQQDVTSLITAVAARQGRPAEAVAADLKGEIGVPATSMLSSASNMQLRDAKATLELWQSRQTG